MSSMTVTLDGFRAARERIAPFVHRTPVHRLPGGPLLKLENLQVTGSFKPRGAFNHVLAQREACAGGVITASSGNHGQAVAHVAKTLGLRAVVVVPEDVAATKAQAITGAGAELIRWGRYSEERVPYAKELAERRGLHYVPPYDDPFIIAGQGTVGLEILEQCPDVEVVVVPVSGGGLISGIAVAVKSLRPQVRLIGAEPAGAARYAASRRAGRPVVLEKAETIADGLRVLTPGHLTWDLTAKYVDEFRDVPDSDTLKALRRILLEGHVLAEPSGAVSVACALAGLPGETTVAVVSGGNIDPPVLAGALEAL
ncbi:MAG: threonine ammonia-lyase [bacterium]